MQKSTKIVIGVLLGVLVLGLTGIVWLIFWGAPKLMRLRDEVATASREEIINGTRDGRSSDETQCIRLVLDRTKKPGGFKEMMALNVYFSSCLRVSHPSAGFCDGVPAAGEVMKTARWRFEKCIQMGGNEQICNMLGSAVIGHCEETRKRGPVQNDPAAEPSVEKEK